MDKSCSSLLSHSMSLQTSVTQLLQTKQAPSATKGVPPYLWGHRTVTLQRTRQRQKKSKNHVPPPSPQSTAPVPESDPWYDFPVPPPYRLESVIPPRVPVSAPLSLPQAQYQEVHDYANFPGEQDEETEAYTAPTYEEEEAFTNPVGYQQDEELLDADGDQEEDYGVLAYKEGEYAVPQWCGSCQAYQCSCYTYEETEAYTAPVYEEGETFTDPVGYQHEEFQGDMESCQQSEARGVPMGCSHDYLALSYADSDDVRDYPHGGYYDHLHHYEEDPNLHPHWDPGSSGSEACDWDGGASEGFYHGSYSTEDYGEFSEEEGDQKVG